MWTLGALQSNGADRTLAVRDAMRSYIGRHELDVWPLQDIQRLWKSARDEGTDTEAYGDGIRPESALPDVTEFMKPKPARRSEPGRIWQWHNAVPEEVLGVDYGNRRSLP
jgi:hypothetical protein